MTPDELFSRYAERLAQLAERHLSRKVAVRVDGADVVQSVFRTYFQRRGRGEFQIDGADEVWRLLVCITVRKAREQGRRHTAEQRDVGGEAADGDAWLSAALAREPDPAEAVLLVDQVETALRGLNPLCRPLLEMRLAGHTMAEIAGELGVSRRLAYFLLDELKRRFRGDAGESP